MSRFTGSTWKVSRRLGYSISETGKELKKRPYAPGQHGQRRSKLSNYGIQLQEKQKVSFCLWWMKNNLRKENKFPTESAKMQGKQGENFLKLLESRLDNVVYRLGFTKTRAQARQLVNHGHILVDGKKVDIPSYRLAPGQTVQLKEKSKNLTIVKEALEAQFAHVDYVALDANGVGTFSRLPERNEFLFDINEQLIVEFYNR